jgi:ABC-type proline/glycine betaine transport system ATPase subunit
MTEFADVKTKYLSGGQQQRVAGVLALEPEILLDEPLVILIILERMLAQICLPRNLTGDLYCSDT